MGKRPFSPMQGKMAVAGLTGILPIRIQGKVVVVAGLTDILLPIRIRRTRTLAGFLLRRQSINC